jgi:hypothetical protein
VGIDGQSAAGKSTWARLIQESLQNVAVVHKDDFYSSAPAETLAGLTASEGYQRFFSMAALGGAGAPAALIGQSRQISTLRLEYIFFREVVFYSRIVPSGHH